MHACLAQLASRLTDPAAQMVRQQKSLAAPALPHLNSAGQVAKCALLTMLSGLVAGAALSEVLHTGLVAACSAAEADHLACSASAQQTFAAHCSLHSMHASAARLLVHSRRMTQSGCDAGLLGIGGGIIISPLLLELGADPLVAAATSALMVLFSSSSAALAYGAPASAQTLQRGMSSIGCNRQSLLGCRAGPLQILVSWRDQTWLICTVPCWPEPQAGLISLCLQPGMAA